MKNLKQKRILLGVSGGIAAYKACEILRRLQEEGAIVTVAMSPAAQKFVTPLTFQSLSGQAVHTDLFSLTEESEMGHIKLADETDLVLFAPATADLLAKLACGMGDEILSTLALVTTAPILLAPSMNVNMWEKEVVQNNVEILKNRSMHFMEPEAGYLACGWTGKGRLSNLESIVQRADEILGPRSSSKKKSLLGKKVLITAGPTREYLDPVRYLSNPSSGKMGFALAKVAQEMGAQVILITGPVSLPSPQGIKRIDVETAEEMLSACQSHFPGTHALIATAAVGDFRPQETQPHKIKKNAKALNLQLLPNPDILKTLAKQRNNSQILVGFAAETQELLKHAQKKLKDKGLDLIVANDVSRQDIGFGSDANQVTLIDKSGCQEALARASKAHIASAILDWLVTRL